METLQDLIKQIQELLVDKIIVSGDIADIGRILSADHVHIKISSGGHVAKCSADIDEAEKLLKNALAAKQEELKKIELDINDIIDKIKKIEV